MCPVCRRWCDVAWSTRSFVSINRKRMSRRNNSAAAFRNLNCLMLNGNVITKLIIAKPICLALGPSMVS